MAPADHPMPLWKLGRRYTVRQRAKRVAFFGTCAAALGLLWVVVGGGWEPPVVRGMYAGDAVHAGGAAYLKAEDAALARDIDATFSPTGDARHLLAQLNRDHEKRRGAVYNMDASVSRGRGRGRGGGVGVPPDENVHFFYTVDGTERSLYQGLALERSWEAAEQPGALTRLVTNIVAPDGTVTDGYERFQRSILHPSAKWFVYFAPGTAVADGVGDSASTVYSIWHWLLHAPPPEQVLALVSADTLFLKPVLVHQHVRVGAAVYVGDAPAWATRGALRRLRTAAARGMRYTGSVPVSHINTCGGGGGGDRVATDAAVDVTAAAPLWMVHQDWLLALPWWIRHVHLSGAPLTATDAASAALPLALCKAGITHTLIDDGTIVARNASALSPSVSFAKLYPPGSAAAAGPLGLPLPASVLPHLLEYTQPVEYGRTWLQHDRTGGQKGAGARGARAALGLGSDAGTAFDAQELAAWEIEAKKPLVDYFYLSVGGAEPAGLVEGREHMHALGVSALLDCTAPILFAPPTLHAMARRRTWVPDDIHALVFAAAVVAGVNDALLIYKDAYCTRPNVLPLWRGAVDKPWLTRYLVTNAPAERDGFAFEPALPQLVEAVRG